MSGPGRPVPSQPDETGAGWRWPGNPLTTDGWVKDMCVVRRGDTYYMFAEGRRRRIPLQKGAAVLKHHVRVGAVALLLGLAGSMPLQAQEVARTFDQLQVLLAPGEKVKISDSDGRVITATVERLSSSSLTVWSHGSRRELQPADIVNIRQRRADSLWNGAAMGCVGGMTFVALTVGLDFDGDVRAFVGFYAGFGLVGGVVGTGIDALIRGWRVTYATPTSATPSAVTVAPLLASGRRGAMVSWRF